jgi:hypothetical protein
MNKECAYCGAVGLVTRDHVPPQGIFSKPRPGNLITVPACKRCHSDETSKDDEYFRLALQVREGIDSHPDVIKTRPTFLRSLQNPRKLGMRNALLKNIVLMELVTPSGIFIKNQWGIQTDINRLRRVVSRTMKGLFYIHKKHRLPDGYDALVCDQDSFQRWPASAIDDFNENMIKPILAQQGFTIGNGVFTYRFGFDKNDPNATCWIFVFYGQAGFLALTLPRANQNIMKLTPTPAQETSLRKLFSGNHIEREQVISIHRPEMQEQMRNLMKATGNANKLFSIMFLDLKHASSEMKAHPGDQFWRRTTIRALAATLDGIVFCLKQIALATGPMRGFKFSEKELFFLSEEVVEPTIGKRPKLPSFRENLKQTFKIFAKAHKAQCPTDFNQDGFAALCGTYELRHRLVHPKSYMTFCVSDDEKQRSGEAIAWLDSEIKKLLGASARSLENT